MKDLSLKSLCPSYEFQIWHLPNTCQKPEPNCSLLYLSYLLSIYYIYETTEWIWIKFGINGIH
jgi:hypothetical protein